MARGAAVVGLGFCTAPAAASAPSLPTLRSPFFAPSSFSLLKKRQLSHLHTSFGSPARLRKCLAQISTSAVPSGMGSDLHGLLVQLELGILQSVGDLGFTLPASEGALSWWQLAVPVVLWYVVAVPGSVSGVLDYAFARLHAYSNISFNANEVEVGRQIGQGSYGIVYEGYIGRGKRKGSQEELHVILKKEKPRSKGATEMHNAEVYMNRRVKRTAPNACADFLGITEVISSQSRGRLSEGLWLVWRYEGDRTLAHYMKQKNFPGNVAKLVLGSKENVEQDQAVIRKITIQILTGLRDLHKTGLVHRDVKPLNLILAEDSGTFKLIDLGAAVDLRSGYNFVPDETIIDPIYAAPERHVMPTSTPQLPPDPLCSVVSPLVWLLNTPDRFDLYSAGLVLLQMAVKPLRQDIGLQTFNTEIKRAGYDLDAWRRKCRFSDEEFSLLDADGSRALPTICIALRWARSFVAHHDKFLSVDETWIVNDGNLIGFQILQFPPAGAAGWELVRSMLQARHDKGLGRSRPSADAALRHRFLTGSPVKRPAFNAPELPAFVYSLRPVTTKLPAFNVPKFPSFVYSLWPFTVKRPVFNAPKLPSGPYSLQPGRVKLPAFKAPKVPSFLHLLEPGKLVPKFSFDPLPKLRDVGSVMPTAAASALTLATGWLIFSALMDSAQKSYAVGQWAVESVGTTGCIFLASSVLARLLLKSQDLKTTSINIAPKMRSDQDLSLAVADIGLSVEDKEINDQLTSNPNDSTERLSLLGLGDAVGTRDQMPTLAAAEVESRSRDLRIRELLASPSPHLRLHCTKTGLAEAVQTMELQLASLESSIAAGRLFAMQQQQQIIQMEKLLTQQVGEAAPAVNQSDS